MPSGRAGSTKNGLFGGRRIQRWRRVHMTKSWFGSPALDRSSFESFDQIGNRGIGAEPQLKARELRMAANSTNEKDKNRRRTCCGYCDEIQTAYGHSRSSEPEGRCGRDRAGPKPFRGRSGENAVAVVTLSPQRPFSVLLHPLYRSCFAALRQPPRPSSDPSRLFRPSSSAALSVVRPPSAPALSTALSPMPPSMRFLSTGDVDAPICLDIISGPKPRIPRPTAVLCVCGPSVTDVVY